MSGSKPFGMTLRRIRAMVAISNWWALRVDIEQYGTSPEGIDSLQRGIVRRQQELHNAAEIIARDGHRRTMISTLLRLITISLGAVAAAKGAGDVLLGNGPLNLVVFSLIGIAISICAGIEAAFSFEKHGAELTMLASSCHATVRMVDTEWRKRIGSASDSDLRAEARKLLTLADEKLAKAQADAAKLGLNITLAVYELEGDDYRRAVAA